MSSTVTHVLYPRLLTEVWKLIRPLPERGLLVCTCFLFSFSVRLQRVLHLIHGAFLLGLIVWGTERTFACKVQECLCQDWYIYSMFFTRPCCGVQFDNKHHAIECSALCVRTQYPEGSTPNTNNITTGSCTWFAFNIAQAQCILCFSHCNSSVLLDFESGSTYQIYLPHTS